MGPLEIFMQKASLGPTFHRVLVMKKDGRNFWGTGTNLVHLILTRTLDSDDGTRLMRKLESSDMRSGDSCRQRA